MTTPETPQIPESVRKYLADLGRRGGSAGTGAVKKTRTHKQYQEMQREGVKVRRINAAMRKKAAALSE